jgi:hypothetical protein
MEPLSMTENALPRDIAAAAADLLDQGATINRLSRPLTIAALIGLIVGLGVELGALLVAGLLLVTLAGLAETYLAIRTGFDAKLFRRLAEGNDPADTLGRLDAALIELGVLTESNPERSIAQRASSARRLLVLQGSALVLQVAVVLLATALAQAHVT